MAIYPAIYAGPPRWYGNTRTDKRYIAIHNTANDASAEGEMSYARRRDDSVSTHYFVDNDSIVQALDTNLRAYHAGSSAGNSLAIAYEITGTNGKSRTWWLANVAWPLLARQIAVDCREHDIEPRLLTVAEIEAGKLTGIITHDQMRQAWGGTTHTDPGPNFPLDHLLELVRAEMGDIDMDLNLNQPVPIGVKADGSNDNVPLWQYLRTVALRLDYLANKTGLVVKLDAILAAALDDGDTTVVLDPAALADLTAVKDAIAALPAAVADAVNDDAAARLAD